MTGDERVCANRTALAALLRRVDPQGFLSGDLGVAWDADGHLVTRRQNALEMSRRAEQAERRALDAEAAIEATRDLLDGWEHDGPDDYAVRLLIQRVREMLAHQQRFEDGRRAARPLPLHRTEAGYPSCATCDGGGCYDCTDPA